MRLQSISPLSQEQEWLAEPVDPSGWLTGTPSQRSRLAGGADRFTAGTAAIGRVRGVRHIDGRLDPGEETPLAQGRPRRRVGRVDRSAELGGARAGNSRRRQRMHSRSLLEQQGNQPMVSAVEHQAVVDTEPEVEGYRMSRWARLALTLTVVAAAAVVIGLLAVGPEPQVLVDVTVGPGDSLWSIASETAPTRDPRAVIEEIRDINGVTSDVLPIGVVLRVPAAGE